MPYKSAADSLRTNKRVANFLPENINPLLYESGHSVY